MRQPVNFNRDSLLCWLDANAPQPSVKRALRSGMSVKILGGFSPLPDSNDPGFIVEANSRTGRVYHVAVVISNFREPRAFMINYIDWKSYTGGSHALYRGDDPAFAEEQRELGTLQVVNEVDDGTLIR